MQSQQNIVSALVRWLPALALAGVSLPGTAARAQMPQVKPTPVSLADGLNLSVEGFARLETRDSSDFAVSSARNPQEEGGRLRFNFSWKPQGEGTAPVSVFLQPQYTYRHTTRAGGPANGTEDHLAIHQGYVDLASGFGTWRVGRQEIAYGEQRLIGHFGWNPTARSFDMVKLSLPARVKGEGTDFFYGRLGHVANKTSNPTLAGAYLTRTVSTSAAKGASDVYLLFKGDRIAGRTLNVYTLGARPKVNFSQTVDGLLEIAGQAGYNAGKDISAWAYSATLGYTLPKNPAGIRFHLAHDFASGGDPADPKRVRTFDQLFPTNHFHYGLADNVGWRNMNDLRFGVRAKPTAQWNVLVEGHRFRLADAKDNWYAAGGAPMRGVNGQPLRDATGAAGRDLGSEIDIQAVYTPQDRIALSAGYARFMPGDFVKRANGGQAETSNWFYLMTNLAY